eukprot:3409017-Prorocentrum_lima.AAC.1
MICNRAIGSSIARFQAVGGDWSSSTKGEKRVEPSTFTRGCLSDPGCDWVWASSSSECEKWLGLRLPMLLSACCTA